MTSAAQDQRYLRLRRYTRRLFPELVCPVHDEIGTPAASGKPSENVWCHGKGADNGHWFTKAERGHQWRLDRIRVALVELEGQGQRPDACSCGLPNGIGDHRC